MESITLFNIVLLPHTFPLVFGLPLLLLTMGIVGGVYELVTKHNEVNK